MQEYGRALLTPAEVNQLPQDDAVLVVGGLLPYRARKVRYFLDPRFKAWRPAASGHGRGATARTGGAGAVRLGGACRGVAARGVSVFCAAQASSEPALSDTDAPAAEPSDPAGESAWASFFASEDGLPSEDEQLDSVDVASSNRKDLPL